MQAGWHGVREQAGGRQRAGAPGEHPVVVVQDEGGGLAHEAEREPEDVVADLVVLQLPLQPARGKHQGHLRSIQGCWLSAHTRGHHAQRMQVPCCPPEHCEVGTQWVSVVSIGAR